MKVLDHFLPSPFTFIRNAFGFSIDLLKPPWRWWTLYVDLRRVVLPRPTLLLPLRDFPIRWYFIRLRFWFARPPTLRFNSCERSLTILCKFLFVRQNSLRDLILPSISLVFDSISQCQWQSPVHDGRPSLESVGAWVRGRIFLESSAILDLLRG